MRVVWHGSVARRFEGGIKSAGVSLVVLRFSGCHCQRVYAGYPAAGSIFRNAGVDFVRPGGDTAFDALQTIEALLAQELQGLHRAAAGFAVEIVTLLRIQFPEPLLKLAQREEFGARDARDLVLVRLAHINHFDAKPRVFQRFFQFVHGNFVGIHGVLGCMGVHATEILIVNQLFDGRMCPAQGTIRISPDFYLPKTHLQSVKKQQPVQQRAANTGDQLEDLGCLDDADDPRQNAQDTAFGAVRNEARRRRLRV